MDYPTDIAHRYADNGDIVPPPYRIVAGHVEVAMDYACLPIVGNEPGFENDHSMYLKFRTEKSYKEALGLLSSNGLGHIAAIYGMKSQKTVYIQMTGA
jgi:hypothetical protein